MKNLLQEVLSLIQEAPTDSKIMDPPIAYPFYLSVRSVSRKFGGHEEGGWYYDFAEYYEDVKYIQNEVEYKAHYTKLVDHWGFTRKWSGSELPPSKWNPIDGTEERLYFSKTRPRDAIHPRPVYESNDK